MHGRWACMILLQSTRNSIFPLRWGYVTHTHGLYICRQISITWACIYAEVMMTIIESFMYIYQRRHTV